MRTLKITIPVFSYIYTLSLSAKYTYCYIRHSVSDGINICGCCFNCPNIFCLKYFFCTSCPYIFFPSKMYVLFAKFIFIFFAQQKVSYALVQACGELRVVAFPVMVIRLWNHILHMPFHNSKAVYWLQPKRRFFLKTCTIAYVRRKKKKREKQD